MKRLFALSALLWAVAAQAEVHEITLEEWSRPRHGESLVRLPALRDAVRQWMAAPAARLVIRYPGGEEGGLWAQELRAWLVSLGVPSGRIELWPGSRRDDAVELEVQP
jgi:hypothetical protein